MSPGDRRRPRFLCQLQHQSVVGELYAWGEFGIGLMVVEVVGYMREVRARGPELGGDGQRLLDVEMRGMFFVAQCVED